MKRSLITIFTLFVISSPVFGQQTYIAQSQDTAYGISRKFGLTVNELYELNPQLRDGTLGIGDVVIVSKSGSKSVVNKNTATAQITVAPGQTLYAISRQYHLSMEDLEKLNPGVTEGLRAGQTLNLPESHVKQFGGNTAVATQPTTQPSANTGSRTYVVQPKDTYYGITHQYNLTQEELFRINPGLEAKGLHPGDVIFVSRAGSIVDTDDTPVQTTVTETPTSQNNQTADPGDHIQYTVQRGDTVFRILNKFKIELGDLLALNPQLNNGLQSGMVLKIPAVKEKPYVKPAGEGLNITMLLPFGFDNNDTKFRQIATDFLSGAKLALERQAETGQKVNVKIVDASSEEALVQALKNIQRSNTDVVIGPLFKSEIIKTLSYISDRRIPVVAPFANTEDLYGYSNLILADTDPKAYEARIIEEVVAAYKGEKILILTGEEAYGKEIQTALKSRLKDPVIELVSKASDLKADTNMMTGRPASFIAVLATDDATKKSGFADQLAQLGSEVEGMKAFSMFYTPEFDTQQSELSSVSLVYLLDRKINTEGSFEQDILKAYDQKYCAIPSRYAVTGFDVIEDVLKRADNQGNIYNKLNEELTHLATKYKYKKTKEGAYINEGYRVIRLVP